MEENWSDFLLRCLIIVVYIFLFMIHLFHWFSLELFCALHVQIFFCSNFFCLFCGFLTFYDIILLMQMHCTCFPFLPLLRIERGEGETNTQNALAITNERQNELTNDLRCAKKMFQLRCDSSSENSVGRVRNFRKKILRREGQRESWKRANR